MIREAVLDDAKRINHLSRSLGYLSIPNKTAAARLQLILNSPIDKVWISEVDSQVIGWVHAFIALRVASAAFIEIGGIAVEPMQRNAGIGRQLVEQVKSWADDSELGLRVRCHSEREGAHEFYQALGFVHTKSQYVFSSN